LNATHNNLSKRKLKMENMFPEIQHGWSTLIPFVNREIGYIMEQL
jgi:hypothetical protein